MNSLQNKEKDHKDSTNSSRLNACGKEKGDFKVGAQKTFLNCDITDTLKGKNRL